MKKDLNNKDTHISIQKSIRTFINLFHINILHLISFSKNKLVLY